MYSKGGVLRGKKKVLIVIESSEQGSSFVADLMEQAEQFFHLNKKYGCYKICRKQLYIMYTDIITSECLKKYDAL